MSRISVILPAFQAAGTLQRTLQSVLDQTFADLEILVIDDGSTDGTNAIAESFRERDPRVQVHARENGGVAEARNFGIERASGEFIAPIDADDLWHPRKLERQLDRFGQANARTGLVYNWFRFVDADDRVTGTSAAPKVEGACLYRHLAYNFIANGSTPLIRRTALGDLRYDPSLAANREGGCEDYLLQLQIARDWEFALVPAWLTGYRKAGPSMSTDIARMIRSHVAVMKLMAADLGEEAQPVIAHRIARLQVEYTRNRLRRGKVDEAIKALATAAQLQPLRLPRSLAEEAVAVVRDLKKPRVRSHFPTYDPDRPDGNWTDKLAPAMERLARLDARMSERLGS